MCRGGVKIVHHCYRYSTGKKTPGGAGTHTGKRDTRTHKGTRTTQTNLTTIQTHQQHTT